LRCPYAFYLLDRGLVPFDKTVNEQQARLLEEGVAFQAGVEAAVVPVTIELAELPGLLAQESIRVHGVPVFENPELEIYGKPDAIDTAQGALFPVEIKSHKDVQRSDELELAFYWMLLEPYRTKTSSPRGYLILRRNGVGERMEVEIRPHRFEQVRGLLQDIRDARRIGVQPRICGCTVCSGVMRDEIRRVTVANKDLTLIWGVGPVSARRLEEIGIRTYDGLLAADSSTIVAALRNRRRYVSPAQVDSWKQHATSYSTSCPVVFGDPLTLDGPFLALDLEYEPGGIIWLVGVCLVGPGSREHFALWADTPAQEKSNLRRLAEIAAANPLLPVVTWNGNGADMPQLRNAAQRLELGETLGIVEFRHLDLFQHARKALRFPIPQLALDQVARYFAIPKISRIRDGLEALFWYRGYRSSRDENRRDALKTNLLDYNRDDLEALVGVAERISGLQCSSQKVPNDGLGANNPVGHEGHQTASLRGGCTTQYHPSPPNEQRRCQEATMSTTLEAVTASAEPIAAQVLRVAELRRRQNEVATKIAEARAAFLESIKPLTEEAEQLGSECEAAEATLRASALAHYEQTREKRPAAGVQVKVYTRLEYDLEKADKWTREQGLARIPEKIIPEKIIPEKIIPEMLDRRAFEKIAKVRPIDFVVKKQEPEVTIAKDLEKALNGPSTDEGGIDTL
jgi:predicted RecB family nuclease